MTDLPPVVLSDAMRRECERKGVTDPDTIETIARFQTFLTVWGRPGEDLPEDRKATARAMLADPEWCEFLGVEPIAPARTPSATAGNDPHPAIEGSS